jgi:hypothetical protein
MQKNQKRTIPATRVEKAWKAYVRLLSKPTGAFLTNRRAFRKHVLNPIQLSRPTPIFTSVHVPETDTVI